ncbi:hypothetical protein [Hydrogenophaga sp.]|uniref:hypothetical protein n=2 Tax=Hydrogenophaga sp. TaxID=1904254 RepID=UPI0027320EB1|nr:hypothetical protein [Hydrogenophaga sp.]
MGAVMDAAQILYGATSAPPSAEATASQPAPAAASVPASVDESPVPGARLVRDASLLYDDPIEIAGSTPRLDEPDLSSAAEVPADLNLGEYAQLIQHAEVAQVRDAIVAAELGASTSAALMDAARMAIRQRGGSAMTAAEAQAASKACESELRRAWGEKYDTNLAKARETFQKAVAKAPALRQFMVDSGLGSDPKVLKLLAARAAKRPGAAK